MAKEIVSLFLFAFGVVVIIFSINNAYGFFPGAIGDPLTRAFFFAIAGVSIIACTGVWFFESERSSGRRKKIIK